MAGELISSFIPEVERPKIQSECGMFALVLPNGSDLSLYSLAYQGISAQQNRAEGAAGFHVSNGKKFETVKALGTVAVAFQEGRNIPQLENPTIALLHTRWPTSGSSRHTENIQPLSLEGITLAHHGNFTNVLEIEEKIGYVPKGGDYPDSDSWVILNAIQRQKGNSLGEKVVNAQRELNFEGGWALIVTDGKDVVASRDPYGIRPLSVGYLGSRDKPQGYAVAVETFGFKEMTKDFHEILPGETIVINEKGIKTVDLNHKGQMPCIFEYVYMSRPESEFAGEIVDAARRRSGHKLWEEAPVIPKSGNKIIVMPIPDSGRTAALGYFHEAQKSLGLQADYDEGILANKYYGRNFIKESKNRTGLLKFSAMADLLNGEEIVLVDDSIVRGDTMPKLVKACYEAGAKKVHVRIASPVIQNPCVYGVAFGTREELFSTHFPSGEKRRNHLGADSLSYLSLQGLKDAVDPSGKKAFCTECFDGKGPPRSSNNVILLDEISMNA